MVVSDQRRLWRELLGGRHDLRANGRVLVHEDSLFAVERPGLEEHVVPDSDLADVMQQASPFDLLDLGLGDVHDPAHGLGDVAHPLRVTSGVPIACVHCVRQRPDGLLEHLARLDVSVVREPRRKQRDDEQERRPPPHAVWKEINLGHQPRQRHKGDDVRCDDPEILRPHCRQRLSAAFAHDEGGEEIVNRVVGDSGRSSGKDATQACR